MEENWFIFDLVSWVRFFRLQDVCCARGKGQHVIHINSRIHHDVTCVGKPVVVKTSNVVCETFQNSDCFYTILSKLYDNRLYLFFGKIIFHCSNERDVVENMISKGMVLFMIWTELQSSCLFQTGRELWFWTWAYFTQNRKQRICFEFSYLTYVNVGNNNHASSVKTVLLWQLVKCCHVKTNDNFSIFNWHIWILNLHFQMVWLNVSSLPSEKKQTL